MGNKQYLFSLTLFLLFSGLLFSQSTDSLINTIRTKYHSARGYIKNYDTITKEEWDEATEGGQIKAYYDKNVLKVIEGTYFGETEKTEFEFYFDDNSLYYVFEKNYTYNRPIYWDKKRALENNDSVTYDPEKTTFKSDGYYFYNETLIRWLNNEKKEVDLSFETNTLVGQRLVDRAHRLQDKLKK